jgi:hypothetical protein
MSRPNSGNIDKAILAVLQADATLASLMPDGVYLNVAAPGLTRFVLVGVFDSTDVGVFGQQGYEDILYFVKANGLSRTTTLANTQAAAQRIAELLDGAILTAPDYAAISSAREQREPWDTVPDPVDASLRWYHYGGYYRVMASWPDPIVAIREIHNVDQERPLRESELGSGGGLGDGPDHFDQHLEG